MTNNIQVKVSVVIPVYNTENYLRKCLDNIVNQTLKDIEIICIDDASTDCSLKILEEYAQKDVRIKILIHYKNKGLSVARNVGAANAVGKFIYFCDSDDWLAVNALELLYEKSKSNNLDILMLDAELFYDNERIKECVKWSVDRYKRKRIYNEILTGKEYFRLLVTNRDYKVNVPLLFIDKAFYNKNGLSFKEGILHEDNLFTFTCLLKAERVAHISKSFYKRRVREGSIMTTRETFDNVYGYFATYLEMLKIIEEVSVSEEDVFAIKQAFSMLKMAENIYSKLDISERNRYLNLTVKERIVFEEMIVKPLQKVYVLQSKNEIYKRNLSELRSGWFFKIGRIITWLPWRSLKRK